MSKNQSCIEIIGNSLKHIWESGLVLSSQEDRGILKIKLIEDKSGQNKEKEYLVTHEQPFLMIKLDGKYKPYKTERIKSIINKKLLEEKDGKIFSGCFANRICDYILISDDYIIFIELKSSCDKKAGQQMFASTFQWDDIKRLIQYLPDLCSFTDEETRSSIKAINFPTNQSSCVLVSRNSGDTIRTGYSTRNECFKGMKYRVLENRDSFKVADMICAHSQDE